MSEHTPGPWRISPFGSQITIMGADDYAVARCNDRAPREHMADARLIAAAPDLLAALKLCVDSAVPHPVEHPTMTAAWKIARAAIAKAEGRQP